MIKHSLSTSIIVILSLTITGLSGCSTIGKVGKSTRNMMSFGQQSGSNSIAVNEELIIPPTLRVPGKPVAAKPKTTVRTNQKKPSAARNYSNKNYYIVVGTYPDQAQAFETFVRLSSIGLPGAAMESRKTKSGQQLHMVRLGPYQKQEDIDKVTNNLTSDGLTQFKVVEN
jgi:cell division protein FtsN